MIHDHSWRPPHGAKVSYRTTWAQRPCEFMNCRRPRAEHARAVSGRHLRVGAQ